MVTFWQAHWLFLLATSHPTWSGGSSEIACNPKGNYRSLGTYLIFPKYARYGQTSVPAKMK